jgi:SagB-type dehydrogenase family enzyme
VIRQYHDRTKHHFHRFAPSLGYMDWATQPDPFRRYVGAPLVALSRTAAPSTLYAAIFDGTGPRAPIDAASVAQFLRHAMGLSAWKQYGASRWALRVNPSSGNLHPTEVYIIWRRQVAHYAPREHALELRCELAEDALLDVDGLLVAVTSIHWREAWKYGERAFRYCQHDAGHALAALRLSAAMLGWRCELLNRWTHDDIGGLLGVDRDADFVGAEREEPEFIAIVTGGGSHDWHDRSPDALVSAARAGSWRGTANRLSRDHVEWPIIDAVAETTRFHGRSALVDHAPPAHRAPAHRAPAHRAPAHRAPAHHAPAHHAPAHHAPAHHAPAQRATEEGAPAHLKAANVILQRRSALGFDPRGALRRETFLAMLDKLRPGAPPWDAIDWEPQVHLALFVHRVLDVTPGIYVYVRDRDSMAELRGAMRPEFLWEPLAAGLYLLAPVDARGTANRLSCDQDIAGDGFFSLGMLARFEQPLRERGEWFYRRLFWETGMIGQVLYLEAEAAGARATGIGCFYDEPVHELLGLTGHAWQSLYHFSMGVPVDDGRLTTEPGYAWEAE